MKTLTRYITGTFVVAFLATLVVFTFVMAIGALFRANELLVRGVAWITILKIFLWGIPGILALSIPISTLTGTLLVFGHLSSDNEVTAMKACGVSMWQIVLGPLVVAAVLSTVCILINNQLVPRSHYEIRVLVMQLGAASPTDLLDEGRFIDEFPGLTIYIGGKKADKLTNIRIYDLRKPGLKREIRAKSGVIRAGRRPGDVMMELYDVRVDPFADDRPGAMYCKKWPLTIEDAFKARVSSKGRRDQSFSELVSGIVNVAKNNPNLDAQDQAAAGMRLKVELHKRLALSVACIAFLMLGFPLGTKAHRRESSVGIGISLLLVFNFYLFIIVAEELAKRPGVHPDVVVWMPVLLAVAIGAFLIRRME